MLDIKFLYKPFIYFDKYSRYALYSALCRRIPEYKNEYSIKYGIRRHILNSSELTIRCDKVYASNIISLLRNGKLEINRKIIYLGEPRICPIVPRENLQSSMVIIKNSKTKEFGHRDYSFLEALNFQLKELEIKNFPVIGDAKITDIKGFILHGYTVRFENLQEDESIRLQYFGLGGKQKMGCGVFL